MERIIFSITDNDLYKFTQQNAVLQCYAGTPVTYTFIDRKPTGFVDQEFLKDLQQQIDLMADLRLSEDEANFFRSMKFLPNTYVEWLRNFRYDPTQIELSLSNHVLHATFTGSWESCILWEVPFLALYSECYYRRFGRSSWTMHQNGERLKDKGSRIQGLRFTDFGTRRRRSYEYQKQAVEILRNYDGFQGTSNVHLAQTYNLKAIGTMAHEWIMGVSVKEGLRHANRHALRAWNRVYKGRLGIALTDTYGTKTFWEDFDAELSHLYDGVRHDSGCPYQFTDNAINHYRSMSIRPEHKTVVYSDGLNINKCVDLANKYRTIGVGQSFGIGTHLTNDVPDEPALNIVVKLKNCDGVEVVKLSDEPGKITGDHDAYRVVRYVFFNTPLDYRS